MKDILVGYCGLFCGGCPDFQNTKNKLMKDKNNIEIVCKGCKSEKTTEWCTICNIKKCCKEKGFSYCLECKLNPCEKLSEFMNQEQYPYHKEVQENMKKLRELGLDKWVMYNEEKYICSNCGCDVNWFEKKCSRCGQDLARSYF
jgi:hypothetical protein